MCLVSHKRYVYAAFPVPYYMRIMCVAYYSTYIFFEGYCISTWKFPDLRNYSYTGIIPRKACNNIDKNFIKNLFHD